VHGYSDRYTHRLSDDDNNNSNNHNEP
jgi:hypothetical protein